MGRETEKEQLPNIAEGRGTISRVFYEDHRKTMLMSVVPVFKILGLNPMMCSKIFNAM